MKDGLGTVLLVVAYVFGGAAVLLITFGPIGWAVGKLDVDLGWRKWVGLWLWTLTCIGVTAGVIVMEAQKHPSHSANHCAEKGGVWSVVGHHLVSSGKSITKVNDYACVMAR